MQISRSTSARHEGRCAFPWASSEPFCFRDFGRRGIGKAKPQRENRRGFKNSLFGGQSAPMMAPESRPRNPKFLRFPRFFAGIFTSRTPGQASSPPASCQKSIRPSAPAEAERVSRHLPDLQRPRPKKKAPPVRRKLRCVNFMGGAPRAANSLRDSKTQAHSRKNIFRWRNVIFRFSAFRPLRPLTMAGNRSPITDQCRAESKERAPYHTAWRIFSPRLALAHHVFVGRRKHLS